jgi:ABC-type glycerol-3-phosphate transport system substrate-binding protein
MNRTIRRTALAGVVTLFASGLAAAQAAEVSLWSFLDPAAEGARSEALRDVVGAFEAADPASKVKTNIVEWDQIVPSLIRAAQAGGTPDIAMVYSPNMPALIASGALMPLDSCFAKIWSDVDRKDVVLLSSAKGSDGAIYGVPYELRVFGFYYRADLLEKAGLKAPTSLDELLSTAQKAAGAGMTGLGMTFSSGGGSVEAIEWFVPMVIGAGAKVLNDDGSAAFNSPQLTDLLNRLRKAVQGDKVLPADVALSSTDDVAQLAQSGRAVFVAEGSQEASSFLETATEGVRWAFIPPPGLNAGTTSPAALNGWNLVIPKAAKNPDGACQMIKSWTSVESQRNQALKAGYLPVRASLASDAALQAPAIASVPTLLNYASTNPLNFTWPENTDLLNEVLSTMIQQVITDKMSPADAIAAAEKDYNSRRQ